jgi:hypothetical protein
MGAGKAVQLLGQGRPRPAFASATVHNFLKPWFFIDVHRGRVSGFYFALKFVD